ncbi:MAG: type 4a pilus biogenesis protein PilO [Nitrospirae bacterium]|nr:type 4a pilus biogenesis protein PilO [Nitrospirota bacterium]
MALADLLKRLDLGKLSARERILAILTIGAVVSVYGGYILMPMMRETKALQAEKISLTAEIQQGMATAPLLQKRAEELRQAALAKEVGTEFTGKAGDLFPGGSRLSGLLEEMTRLARLRRIEFVSVRPDAIEDKGAYLQLTLQIDVQSRFRELGDYLLMLENLPRAVLIQELKVETRVDVSPSVLAHLKVMTYLGKE